MVYENKTVLVDLPGTLGYDWITAATTKNVKHLQ
jgi:hypothetical protein